MAGRELYFQRPDGTWAGHRQPDRKVLGHKPVFAGTRVPVSAVLPYLKRGLLDEEILEAFPQLTKADIDREFKRRRMKDTIGRHVRLIASSRTAQVIAAHLDELVAALEEARDLVVDVSASEVQRHPARWD